MYVEYLNKQSKINPVTKWEQSICENFYSFQNNTPGALGIGNKFKEIMEKFN